MDTTLTFEVKWDILVQCRCRNNGYSCISKVLISLEQTQTRHGKHHFALYSLSLPLSLSLASRVSYSRVPIIFFACFSWQMAHFPRFHYFLFASRCSKYFLMIHKLKRYPARVSMCVCEGSGRTRGLGNSSKLFTHPFCIFTVCFSTHAPSTSSISLQSPLLLFLLLFAVVVVALFPHLQLNTFCVIVVCAAGSL